MRPVDLPSTRISQGGFEEIASVPLFSGALATGALLRASAVLVGLAGLVAVVVGFDAVVASFGCVLVGVLAGAVAGAFEVTGVFAAFAVAGVFAVALVAGAFEVAGVFGAVVVTFV